MHDRIASGQEGFTLIEALIAGAAFMGILLGLLGLYKAAWTSFDIASTQTFMQRTGTAVVEQMQRELTTAAALQVQPCGPQGAVGKAVMYMTSSGSTRCIFEWTDTADPGPQLYRCALASWVVGGACTNTPENLLLTQHPLPARVVTRIVARNIAFRSVPSLPNGSGNPDDPGRQVVSPLFDLRFDLDIPSSTNENFINQPSDSFPGQRFAASFTTRN